MSENKDNDLKTRSILGFAEMFHALGSCQSGSPIRHEQGIGAHHIGEEHDPFFDSVVVPPGATAPQDALSHYVWNTGEPVSGRVEEVETQVPSMGAWLDGLTLPLAEVSLAPVEVLARLNEHVYGVSGFQAFLKDLSDPRVGLYGIQKDGEFVSVAMSVLVGDDLGIHYVATHKQHQRRGFATALVAHVMAQARSQGARSATLQASEEGFPVWEALGFKQVTTLHAWVRG